MKFSSTILLSLSIILLPLLTNGASIDRRVISLEERVETDEIAGLFTRADEAYACKWTNARGATGCNGAACETDGGSCKYRTAIHYSINEHHTWQIGLVPRRDPALQMGFRRFRTRGWK
ncbi:hypothetical protein C8J56DRAFT_896605 [Mycena floridula]|nr:hypothetical protein C8J56DRAFT_896605 [Mycena floridula]